jgi:hypothetical protein
VNNTGAGVSGIGGGNTTFSSILWNGNVGARNIDLMNNCNIWGNSNYDYEETRIRTAGQESDVRFNYWGSATVTEMAADPYPGYITAIHDGFDDPFSAYYANYGGVGEFSMTPVADAPDQHPPAFLLHVIPNRTNSVNVGKTTFTLTFSKAMNTTVEPAVTFGLNAPYTTHIVKADPGWFDAVTWQGFFWMQSDTGDGVNTIRVSQATDAGGFLIPDDISREFEIDTTGGGSANNGLATALGETKMQLSWDENAKPLTAQGFNIRRSLSPDPGTFTRINSSLVLSPSYQDSGLRPGTLYFYIVDIVDSNNNTTQWTPPFFGLTHGKAPESMGWLFY